MNFKKINDFNIIFYFKNNIIKSINRDNIFYGASGKSNFQTYDLFIYYFIKSFISF